MNSVIHLSVLRQTKSGYSRVQREVGRNWEVLSKEITKNGYKVRMYSGRRLLQSIPIMVRYPRQIAYSKATIRVPMAVKCSVLDLPELAFR